MDFKYKGFTFKNKYQELKSDWPYTVELWYDNERVGVLPYGSTQYDLDKMRIINTILNHPWPKRLETIMYDPNPYVIYTILHAQYPTGILKEAIERLENGNNEIYS